MKSINVVLFLVNFQLIQSRKQFPLRVLVRKLEPYAIRNADGLVHGGIDITLMNTFAKILNVSIKYIPPKRRTVTYKYLMQQLSTRCEFIDWQEVEKWGSRKTYLITICIYFRRVDLIIGGIPIYASNSSRQMHPIVYNSDQLTWCVSHAKLMPVWKNILRFAKDEKVAMLSIISFYAIALSAFVLTGWIGINWDIHVCLLNALEVVLQKPIRMPYNTKLSGMILLGSGLLMAFVYAIIILCFYIAVIEVRYFDKQITTRHELIRKKFQLGGDVGH